MTFFSITTFQWSLYLCVVALKRCFTLGEMCVISESAAVVIHKALELIFATVSYSNIYMGKGNKKRSCIMLFLLK